MNLLISEYVNDIFLQDTKQIQKPRTHKTQDGIPTCKCKHGFRKGRPTESQEYSYYDTFLAE